MLGTVLLLITTYFFSTFECDIRNYEINKTSPEWHNYFLCGLRGMTEFLGLSASIGLNCMIDGTVPSSAGLSSSSALVCCAALVTMHANGQARSKVTCPYESLFITKLPLFSI